MKIQLYWPKPIWINGGDAIDKIRVTFLKGDYFVNLLGTSI